MIKCTLAIPTNIIKTNNIKSWQQITKEIKAPAIADSLKIKYIKI